MNSSVPLNTTILINLDLLFDLYSVLFSIYRTHFAKLSIPIHDLKHLIEGKNIQDGLRNLIEGISEDLKIEQVTEEVEKMIPMSLSSIKPNIGIYTLLADIEKNGTIIKVFTNFEEVVINSIKEAHKSWFNYEIIQQKDNETLKKFVGGFAQTSAIFIDSSVQNCFDVKSDFGLDTIYVPNSKKSWEFISENSELKEALAKQEIQIHATLDKVEWDKLGVKNTVKWPEPSYYLQLNEKPKNLEYNIWGNITKLDESIELTSNVVHGYGRGGKKLGIPTANLDMTPEIEKKLNNLVSGVYYGWAEFLPTEAQKDDEIEYNNQYPMVMSIGFNPYFNNKHKTAEAHIMKKFDKDFYGSKVTVTILGFIRNELDFMSFSHLIEAIHNDVQLTKDILGVAAN